jgi:hypothetical protein
MPLTSKGHGAFLNQSMAIAHEVYKRLEQGPKKIRLLPAGDTNVVCFAVAEEQDTVKQANGRTESLLSFLKASPELSVTRTHLGFDNYRDLITATANQWRGVIDDDHLTVVRMVVMNPYLDDQQIVEHITTTLLRCLEETL